MYLFFRLLCHENGGNLCGDHPVGNMQFIAERPDFGCIERAVSQINRDGRQVKRSGIESPESIQCIQKDQRILSA